MKKIGTHWLDISHKECTWFSSVLNLVYEHQNFYTDYGPDFEFPEWIIVNGKFLKIYFRHWSQTSYFVMYNPHKIYQKGMQQTVYVDNDTFLDVKDKPPIKISHITLLVRIPS